MKAIEILTDYVERLRDAYTAAEALRQDPVTQNAPEVAAELLGAVLFLHEALQIAEKVLNRYRIPGKAQVSPSKRLILRKRH